MVSTNSKLKNLFKLSHKVTVYVPGTNGATTEADNTEVVNHVASNLSSFFGGATSSPAVGYWVSGIHGLIRENTTIVFAYATEHDLYEHVDDVVELCEEMKRTLAQESIALEIDGEMYFI